MFFPLVKEKDIAFVNYLMVRNGTIVQTQTNKVETHLDETQEEILSFSVAQLRTTFNSDATEIIVPFAIEYPQDRYHHYQFPKEATRKNCWSFLKKMSIILLKN